MRAGARNATISRLELLKSLPPGDTYSLLFYFARYFIGCVFLALAWLVVGAIVVWLAHLKPSPIVFASLVAGCRTSR
jgi:hypothetical protein